MADIVSLTPSQPGSIAQADVPTDVWLEIIAHLEAPDVLSLQSTCKLLHDALHEKSVWISVLQQGCSRDGVYFPSYPVAEMDIRRLQRAALGPYRLYRLVESCSAHSSYPPRLNPIFNTLATTLSGGSTMSWTQEVKFLVPGGRYLLTGDSDALSLWDLGPPDLPAFSEPIIITRAATESHPAAKNHGRPHLSVRIRHDDTLRIALAVGGTLLTVYDVNLSDTSPCFRRIATLAVSSTEEDSFCTALSISDDVVLSAIGITPKTLVWNFREGWYAFGPIRRYGATNHVITSKNVVIECDNVEAYIWIAEADSLDTFATVTGEAILLSDPNHLYPTPPTPVPMPNPRPSNPREQPMIWTILPAGLSLDGSDSVTFDMLFMNSTFHMSTAERDQEPIRGYRYKLRPIRQHAGGEGYTAEFKQEIRFNLPPNMKAFRPEASQFPGRRGSGSIYGSALFIHGNGWTSYPGRNPRHAFHCLYSLPNRRSDAHHTNSAVDCTTKSLNDELPSDNAVIHAGLTCLWGGFSNQPCQVCTVSGRFLVVEDDALTQCRVYDFLRPWNHVDAIRD